MLLDKIPPYLKNKYVLSLLGFTFWIAFFDENNLIDLIEYKLELNHLTEEQAYYKQEITKAKKDLEDLTTNVENLERFAREKYLMKRDNEEIFVLSYPDS